MDPSLKTSATGMQAQQTRMEVIANNLANATSTAFKRSRANFEDLLYQTVEGAEVVDGADAQSTEAVQVGRGVRLAGVQRIHSQGPLEQTGRQLDIAIEGDGFLQVRLPTGEIGYTRDGALTISDQGTLVTRHGYAALPGIQVPPDATELSISGSGIVSVVTPGSADLVDIGRLELSRFSNPSGMAALGQNLFAETAASGQPIVGFPQEPGFGRVVQGALEGSNVEIVREMVDMITTMRAYEINSKAIQTSDEMSQVSTNLVR